MHELSVWLGSPIIDFQAAAARLLLTFLAAGLIGLEREARKQTAGWRTHIVIGLGASLMMILSIWLPQTINPGAGDPGRLRCGLPLPGRVLQLRFAGLQRPIR